LKRDSAKDIYLFGSADLAASLIPHRLIDEFRIGLNPLVLGAGSPLFRTSAKVRLRLLDSRSLSNGIVIVRHEPN
jgi:dihydrofolate reductase